MPDAVAAGKKFIERCVIESYPLGGGRAGVTILAARFGPDPT